MAIKKKPMSKPLVSKTVSKTAGRPAKKPLPLQAFASQKTLREWLTKHHDKSNGMWLQLAKKDSGVDSPSYKEALDVALCFGWIDGQRGAIDDKTFKQMFTPRAPRSIWSTINREHVARLIASGEMTEHGLHAVERAKENGQWERAYEGAKKSTVPEDLQRALDANPKAKGFFATLSGGNRYAIFFRIQNVKQATTRARKISEYVAMLARHETIY